MDSRGFKYPPSILQWEEAVNAYNESNGSDESLLLVLTTYRYLLKAHYAFLNPHLGEMESSGGLVSGENNDMTPDPNGPPKRGQGLPLNPEENNDMTPENVPPKRGRSLEPKDPPSATESAPPKDKKACSSV